MSNEVLEFEGEYFGGNFQLKNVSSFLQKTNVQLKLEENTVAIYPSIAPLSRQYVCKPAFLIRYDDLVKVESLPSEKISTLRVLISPIGGLLFRKKELFLTLSFKDNINMEQSIVFRMNKPDEVHKAIYDRVAETRQKVNLK